MSLYAPNIRPNFHTLICIYNEYIFIVYPLYFQSVYSIIFNMLYLFLFLNNLPFTFLHIYWLSKRIMNSFQIKRNIKIEMRGIDPCTSCMLSECSTIWATSPHVHFLKLFNPLIFNPPRKHIIRKIFSYLYYIRLYNMKKVIHIFKML